MYIKTLFECRPEAFIPVNILLQLYALLCRLLSFLAFYSLVFFLCHPPFAILLLAKEPLCGLRLGRVLSHLEEG